jgi:hypothetical protein
MTRATVSNLARGRLVNPAIGSHPAAIGSTHVVPVVGSGLTVAGAYSDDHFKIAFRTGGLATIPPNDPSIICPPGSGIGGIKPGCIEPYYCYPPYFPYGNWYPYVDDGYYSEPVQVIGVPETPAAAPAPAPPPPMTDLERAASFLRYGDAQAAAAAYSIYLKSHPNDSEAMRGLGLSLIDAGQVGDGVAVIGMAYRSDSTLAATPVSPSVYTKTDRFRSNLSRVSAYANREKSASGWLTLTMMMQAEGRYKQAREMLERAKKAGLEAGVAQEMTAALAGLGGR